MKCPVCTFESEDRVCPRCGTDVAALEGQDGDARLEIRPTHRAKARGGPAPPLR